MSITPISDLSFATGGFEVGDSTNLTNIKFSTVLGDGSYVPIQPTTTPNQSEADYSTYNNDVTKILSEGSGGIITGVPPGIYNPGIYPIVLNSGAGYTQYNIGQNLNMDPAYVMSHIGPALNPRDSLTQSSILEDNISYTGSDIRLMIEIPGPPRIADATSRYYKQLVEATTITVSVHREKAAVRACGYINPKGFARGKRTIAGTLILTQFNIDVLYTFLQGVLYSDLSKDSNYVKVDQLPSFDITIFFNNEYGYASYRQLLGVEFVTDGTVYSIQDMLTEQVISFVCYDFTPLLPIGVSPQFTNPILFAPTTSAELSPTDTFTNLANSLTGKGFTKFGGFGGGKSGGGGAGSLP